MQVQAVLKADPFSGLVFCFRGRRGDLGCVLNKVDSQER